MGRVGGSRGGESKPRGATPLRTAKYLRRQREILNAAVDVLNQKGVKGMTRALVAERFGIVATGVTYYFASKEELAAACFMKGIATYQDLIVMAGAEGCPEDRIGRLMRSIFDLRRRIAQGEAEQLVLFDDIRALNDPRVFEAYVKLFHSLRALIAPGLDTGGDRVVLNSRVHLLLQQIMWLPIWLPMHHPEAYARAADRFIDILLNGLGATPLAWPPPPLTVKLADTGGSARETFLRAATQLINEEGIHGASIDRIAARLDLTKGAFYHHLDAKDDLLEICFSRTIALIRSTQRAGDELAGDGQAKLLAVLASLIERQVIGDEPLLRPALTSLPDAARSDLLAEFDRITAHFGSMLSDGVADGSVRPIDTQIAAQMVTAAVNASAELTNWLPRNARGRSTEAFVRSLFEGLSPDAR